MTFNLNEYICVCDLKFGVDGIRYLRWSSLAKKLARKDRIIPYEFKLYVTMFYISEKD